MRKTWLSALLLALSLTPGAAIDVDLQEILGRGDSNNDGRVNISDTSFLCLYLFAGGQVPPCLNQADVDDNGRL
ncbi:MAG: dockerin type I domain-containing protein, partial [Planctomycetota bacterium]|nr:dockerin type I domain-containing protein [Planctomycetota bacterium]